MVASLFLDHFANVKTSGGKTFGFDLEFALQSYIRAKEFKGVLVVEKSSALERFKENTDHTRLMRNFGLKYFIGKEAIEKLDYVRLRTLV